MARQSRCKRCNQPITFLRTRGGWMPVNGNVQVKGNHWDARMGSHWETCPMSAEFRQGRAPESDGPLLEMLEPGRYVPADELANEPAEQPLVNEVVLQAAPEPVASAGRRVVELHVAGFAFNHRGPGGWCCSLVSGDNTLDLKQDELKTTMLQATWLALLAGVRKLRKPCRIEISTSSLAICETMNIVAELELDQLVCSGRAGDKTEELKQAVIGLLKQRKHQILVCHHVSGSIWPEADIRAHDIAKAEALKAQKKLTGVTL